MATYVPKLPAPLGPPLMRINPGRIAGVLTRLNGRVCRSDTLKRPDSVSAECKKGNAMRAYKRILVPTDGTTLSLKAAREASVLARDLNAKLTAIYVMAPFVPPMMVESAALPAEAFDERAYRKAVEATAKKALDKARSVVAEAKVDCDTLAVTDDHPWKGIVKAARECDLIVMASHGRTGIAAMVLGSETRKVLAHSTRPVLVCH